MTRQVHPAPGERPPATQDSSYTERLVALETVWWKRLLDVQAPYRWNLNRLCPGSVLEVGCGIGRNLVNLRGRGVGVDHNQDSIRVATSRGLTAFTVEEFLARRAASGEQFDSLLLSHVVEHMTFPDAVGLLRTYLPHIRPDGVVLVVVPQQAGFASDPTHREYFDAPKLRALCEECGLRWVGSGSFPFPARIGRLFRYNETTAQMRKPDRWSAASRMP